MLRLVGTPGISSIKSNCPMLKCIRICKCISCNNIRMLNINDVCSECVSVRCKEEK